MRCSFDPAFASLLCFLLVGCTNTIIPPKSPRHPVTVYLLDHGRHPSLVVPAETGLIRYSYGEWNWYALGNTGAWQAFSALFLPTPSALGQKPLPTPEDFQRMLQNERPEHVHPLQVDQARVEQLRRQLDALFQRDAKRHFNKDYDLDFVQDPRCYTLFRNSNHVTAGWLRKLGCTVRGSAMFSAWRVREPR